MNLNKITINGVEIPLEKVCEECGGLGYHDMDKEGIGTGVKECSTCQATGKQPIYYTPQQIEELTGEKLPDNTVIWYNIPRAKKYAHEYLDTGIRLNLEMYVYFPFQPAPPADYRVKE